MPEILSIGELLDLGNSAATAGLIPYSALEYNGSGDISGISGSAIAGGVDSAVVSSIVSSYVSSKVKRKLRLRKLIQLILRRRCEQHIQHVQHRVRTDWRLLGKVSIQHVCAKWRLCAFFGRFQHC